MIDGIEIEELVKNFERYAKIKQFDLSKESHQKFFSSFCGAILMLVPEAAAFLIESGLEDNDDNINVSMAAIGETLMVMGKRGLDESNIQ